MYVQVAYAYRRGKIIEGNFEDIKNEIVKKLNSEIKKTRGNCIVLKFKVPSRKLKTFLNFLESSGFEIHYSRRCILRLREKK